VAEAAWLEISLIVDGEMAEAVAEVMSRYIPDGIAIESTEIPNRIDKPEQTTGPLRVSGFLPMDSHLEETRHQVEEALWHLGQIQPLPSPEYKPIQETNWMEAWKENYRPIPVGKKLIILPAWIENPEPNRIPIKIDPGMAFGTGVHPTTQLSLRLIEEYIRPGEMLFDIGSSMTEPWKSPGKMPLRTGSRRASSLKLDRLKKSMTVFSP
jgi:ribosomal protein L11 methyltransferase